MKHEVVIEVARSLIGPIRPVGESQTDEARLENLKEMIVLVDVLISDIDRVAYDFQNNHQASMKLAAKTASDGLDQFGITETPHD